MLLTGFQVLYKVNTALNIPGANTRASQSIHVNLIGNAARVTSLTLQDSDTIYDLVRMAVRCHTLRLLKPAVYYPQYRSGPIDYRTSLSSIGISNGSVLYIRWRLLGGTSRTSQMDANYPTQPESTSRLDFTARTGRLDTFNY
ncbi:hypothetical protein H0H92_012709 [Tricholoma furcatifolium]|nr:hypothetical protein H0H92_012709 [Tricholoma furcatifolium]